MLRRIMIMGAALLSALALSTGPANAGPGEIEMWRFTNFVNTFSGSTPDAAVAEANIPASCTAVPVSGGVQSANNRTTAKAVAFYNDSACANVLQVVLPGTASANLGGTATHYSESALRLFEATGFGPAQQTVLESAITTSCTAVATPSGQARSASNATSSTTVILFASLADCPNGPPLATLAPGSVSANLGGVATHYKK